MSAITATGVLHGSIAIGGGAKLEDNVNANASTTTVEVTPSSGYDGMKKVTISAIETETVSVKSTTTEQEILPTQGKLISGITVQPFNLQPLTVTLRTARQVILPADLSQDCDGFSGVIVPASIDTLNELFNTNSATPIDFTMEDRNAQHTCYGYSTKLNVTLSQYITTIAPQAFINGNLKSISGSGVTNIGYQAFANNASLNSVDFPHAISIGSGAFMNSRITSIRFEDLQQFGDGALESCHRLTDVYLGFDGVVGFANDAASVFEGTSDTVTVHVPSTQILNYQNNQSWQDLISYFSSDMRTLTIVGDYV